MNILFFGDIVGRPGREAVKKILPQLKKDFAPDLVIANGENLAHGFGISEKTAKEMLASGVDVITGGNHSFENKNGLSLFADMSLPLIRPLNYGISMPGKGNIELMVKNIPVIVVNLIGNAFMRTTSDNPFVTINNFLDEHAKKEGEKTKIIIIDWHAEATSEKVAMGKLVDGRVSAVLGTHTHVPTSDYEVLPGGTAFVSDVGMCGPKDSVIGMEKSEVLRGFLNAQVVKYEVANGPVEINAILLTIDETNGKAIKIDKVYRVV